MRAIAHEERILQNPVTGAVIAAIATAASITEQQKASKASKRSQAAQQRAANEQTARQRRQQLREARIQRALTESQAVAAGVQGSSAVVGAQSGIQSQLGSNIAFLSGQQGLSNAASIENQKAADAQTRASIFSSVASLSSTTGNSGIFNQPTQPPQVVKGQ